MKEIIAHCTQLRILSSCHPFILSSCHLVILSPSSRRYAFCCTFPILIRGHSLLRISEEAMATFGRWALPTTASCGARTFLSPVGRQRHRSNPRGFPGSDRPAGLQTYPL